VMAEEVPASELRYVVPFEARSRYVGADYVEQLAGQRFLTLHYEIERLATT
jgi:hypothetical protein